MEGSDGVVSPLPMLITSTQPWFRRGAGHILTTLIVLAAASAPALALIRNHAPARAQRPAAPLRFMAQTGLTPSLRGGWGAARVQITLRAQPMAAAAQNPARRHELSGRLSNAELAVLRRPHDHAAERAIVAAHNRARQRALAAVQAAVIQAGRELRPVAQAVRSAGGRLLGTDVLNDALIAAVPVRRLASLAARPDVLAISPARAYESQGAIATQTSWVGAPSWWAANFLGGTGSADTTASNLVILNDKIQEDHPAFAAITFERPQGMPVAGDWHGTGVAGAAFSAGASGCGICVADDANEKGVAPGPTTVLDSQVNGNYDQIAWSQGLTQTDPLNSQVLPGATHHGHIFNGSYGSQQTSSDDSIQLQNIDNVVSTFGLTLIHPAGNQGPAASTTDEPCIAYNAICVGAVGIDYSTHANDVIATFSSRGPTPAGRKKPDLVAVGAAGASGNMSIARNSWQADSNLWRGDNGTSYASPQVAGAATLLRGTGITDPMAQKAILIDSARQGRATPASAMGTQTGWQADWGWGELDLTAALAQRTNFDTRSVKPATDPTAGVQFYSASTAAPGDRATLVWDRRSTGCLTIGCMPTAYTLSNLDLFEYDRATQALRASSTSTIEDVEQVSAPGADTVLYKIKNQSSSVDHALSEPFALAATNQVTALKSPVPSVTGMTLSAAQVRQGDPVTVSAVVTNTSDTMTAPGVQSTLQLPPGVSLISGSATIPLGDLAPNQQVPVNWSVQGTSDGLKALIAQASTQAGAVYGETFTASATQNLLVDSTPPTVTVNGPTGDQTSLQIPLGWGASDSGSGVANYDVDVQIDSGSFTAVLAGTGATSVTYTGAAGHTYAFRVRARDNLGNTSGYVTAGPVTILSSAPNCQKTNTCPRPKASASLSVRRARWSGRTLSLMGRAAGGLTARLRVQFRCAGRTARTSLRRVGKVWNVKLRLSSRCSRSHSGKLTITYAGDRHHKRQTMHSTIRRR